MNIRTLNDHLSSLEEVYALLEVSGLALRKLAGCETVCIEKTLRIAEFMMDSAITGLQELVEQEVQE